MFVPLPPAVQTALVSLTAGILVMVLARRLRLPAIVLLLLGGVALGPAFLDIVRPASLGAALRAMIAVSVALILFEGGLTLDVRKYPSASRIIRRLLTVGVLVTWGVISAAILFILGLPLRIALLAASLVVVTGPTVISPLLRRVRVRANLHTALYWESVLVDPVGVFLAVLLYETVARGHGTATAAGLLSLRLLVGLGIGTLAGLILDATIRRLWVPEDQINIFALAVALATFGVCNRIIPESGILGVVAAGFVLGLRRPKPLERLRRFKLDIAEMLIGTLFILLSANLDLESFRTFGWRGALVVLVVVAVARPLSVFASAAGTDLTRQEKLFLSWVAPRGVVAASMASLFALELTAAGDPDGRFLETFTYSVIATTVILQGSTAGLAARWLRVQRPEPRGLLVVGAHLLGRELARFAADVGGRMVVLIDSNARDVGEAQAAGLTALPIDAFDPALHEGETSFEIGALVAATDNEHLNALICHHWQDVIKPAGLYRWARHAAAPEESPWIGSVAWPRVVRPSRVGAEVEAVEARIRRATWAEAAEFGDDVTVLAACEGDRLWLGPPDAKAARPETPLLVLERLVVRVSSFVSPTAVVFPQVHDVESLFRELLIAAHRVDGTLSQETLLAELLEREHSLSTAIGHRVAIPHLTCPGLVQPLCAVAPTPGGIDFGAYDGGTVKLTFLLLGPPEDAERHLTLLAQIAHVAADSAAVERLAAAESGDELCRRLREVEAGLPRSAVVGPRLRVRTPRPPNPAG